MVLHGVEHIDLPMTTPERYALAQTEEEGVDFPQDRGDCVRIDFNAAEQRMRSSATKPRSTSLEELRIAFVTYLKEFKPELLACQVEAYLEGRKHRVLWTPLYCLELQPIELFWAAGKNNDALNHCSETKMIDVVKYLQEGWYGNGEQYPEGHPKRKKPEDCWKMWAKCLMFAGTKYCNLCNGILGLMGELVVDENAIDEEVNIPIDTLVVRLTHDVDQEGVSYEAADL